MIKYVFIILFIPSIVFAEIENARDLMEEGKFKEAIEYFENAININPNYVDASNNLKIARSLLK